MQPGATRQRVAPGCITQLVSCVTQVTSDSMITLDTTFGEPLARSARSPIELSSRRPDRGFGNRGRPRETACGTWESDGRETGGSTQDEATCQGSEQAGSPACAGAVGDEAADPRGPGRAVQLGSRPGGFGCWMAGSGGRHPRVQGRYRFAGVVFGRQRRHGAPPTHTWRGPDLVSTCLHLFYRLPTPLPGTSCGVSPARPANRPQDRNSAAFCCSAAAYCWPA
jgi:hypothetical protein